MFVGVVQLLHRERHRGIAHNLKSESPNNPFQCFYFDVGAIVVGRIGVHEKLRYQNWVNTDRLAYLVEIAVLTFEHVANFDDNIWQGRQCNIAVVKFERQQADESEVITLIHEILISSS